MEHNHLNCNNNNNSNDFFHSIEKLKLSKNEIRLEQSKKRIIDLTKQIEKAENINTSLNNPNNNNNNNNNNINSDWTQTYQFWNKWEDVEELVVEKENEKTRLQNFIDENNFMGHCNDHTEERKFFELPEPEKLKYCEDHRILGNYLFSEGLLPKAAEQYQLALSYYEYCFPDSDFEQRKLDILRHACLCNISLCFLKLGHLREAEERVSQAISEVESRPSFFDEELIAKSYYRRAQVRRSLDEYEKALSDIERVISLCPNDSSAINEKLLIQSLIQKYEKDSQRMASVMLGTSLPSVSSSTITTTSNTKEETDFDFNHYPILNLDLPLEPNLFFQI